jgi:predicted ester cyclase
VVAQDVIANVMTYTDAESMRQGIAMRRNSSPGMQITSDDERAVEDKVISHWTICGTHQDEERGIPATGKEAIWSGITIFRLSGGKIAEFWTQVDRLGLMKQLGAVLVPGAN